MRNGRGGGLNGGGGEEEKQYKGEQPKRGATRAESSGGRGGPPEEKGRGLMRQAMTDKEEGARPRRHRRRAHKRGADHQGTAGEERPRHAPAPTRGNKERECIGPGAPKKEPTKAQSRRGNKRGVSGGKGRRAGKEARQPKRGGATKEKRGRSGG